MTVKRFTIGMLKKFVNDNETNYCYSLELQSDAEHLCEFLNEQHETIQRLKQNIDELMQFDVEEDLLKENEQLKTFLESMKEELSLANRDNTTLEKENEELKQSMQEAYQYFVDYLNELREDIDYEQYNELWNNLQKINNTNEDNMFIGCDAEHYQRWIKEIKPYVDDNDFNYTDDFIIKLALSYTLQSLRNGESLKRFQWDYDKLNRGEYYE